MSSSSSITSVLTEPSYRNKWLENAEQVSTNTLKAPMQRKEDQLGAVLVALDRHLQRATYAAVGGVVGLPARSVMLGQAKSAMNSWVVSKKKHLPTGYAVLECHPRLTTLSHVINSPDELRVWLNGHS